MDFRNTFSYHSIVALISVLLILLLYFTGTEFGRAVAGIAFLLLFLTLIVGPIMRLWKPATEALPWNLPWSWRSELGIWFTIFSVGHMLLVFDSRYWDVAGYLAGMRLSDLVAFVAIFWSLVLTAASFAGVIKFLGISAWRWLHGFAYVIFYLAGAHVINHAFLRTGHPTDWLHWAYLLMIIVIILLQSAAFVKTVVNYRKTVVR
jgi:sulfoxide reductase heme-binding subunit YedZ